MSHPTSPDADDEMLPEYDFSRGVRGTHHQAYKAGTNVVFLDPDVAEASLRANIRETVDPLEFSVQGGEAKRA